MRELLRLPHPKSAGQPIHPGGQLQQVVFEAIQNLLRDELVTRLYGTNPTPAEGATLASFVEISGRGYAAKPLFPEFWSLIQTSKGFHVFEYGKPLVFEFTGAGGLKVYGYYVTRRKDGALVWRDRLHPVGTLPIDYFVAQNDGDMLTLKLVTPVWIGGLGP
jgi:hypothetical protein